MHQIVSHSPHAAIYLMGAICPMGASHLNKHADERKQTIGFVWNHM
jgi:hypothetical protein